VEKSDHTQQKQQKDEKEDIPGRNGGVISYRDQNRVVLARRLRIRWVKERRKNAKRSRKQIKIKFWKRTKHTARLN